MISTTAWLIVSDLSLHIEVLQLFSFLTSEFPSARQKAKKNSHIGFISSKNTFFIFVFIFFASVPNLLIAPSPSTSGSITDLYVGMQNTSGVGGQS